MEWRNPQYNAAGAIECEINHPQLGWIPFTASAGDTGARFDVAAMLAEIVADGNIAAYDGPSVAELSRATLMPLTRRQVFIMLASEGFLSEADAEQAASGNAVPAGIAAAFDAKVASGEWTAAERLAARITFLSFTQAPRLDPMVPLLVASAGTPPADEALDAWWAAYAAI